MLEANKISYRAGQKTILDNISFTLKSSELLAIVGANGAGKSTLLKCISGEYTIADNNIRLHGTPLSAYSAKQLACIRAMLSQQTYLSMPFKVKEVVQMGRYPHATSIAENEAIGDICLKKTGVMHLKNRNMQTLSGGEQQRVHLARILAQLHENQQPSHNLKPLSLPKLLLLDEPVSSLDLKHQQNTLRIAREIASAGHGVIAVLHDINLASQYADKILMLKNGQVHFTGSPHEIITTENIARVFDIEVHVIHHPEYGYPMIFPNYHYEHVLEER